MLPGMADTPRYWSPEFVDVFKQALEEDPAFQKAARNFSDKVVLRCTDTPDGKDMSAVYTIDHGKVDIALTVEEAPSRDLREAPFDRRRYLARTTAPYRLWVRLDKGEMNVLQALASPDYKVEGPKLKIMANMGMLNAMNAVAAKTPKTY